ncbi:hypothetical protein CYMTET_33343 [Cymbomonas tetramitiformis]|uniref:Uncharacterized protein n=1 Tax=Cymbomonas tetramitiformis TaxID=36881 RepID=A0AAE0FDA7_9CHLO|nr:hypothetical protein CYMTET_33343 [Cymbomonas tetramitiformis]
MRTVLLLETLVLVSAAADSKQLNPRRSRTWGRSPPCPACCETTHQSGKPGQSQGGQCSGTQHLNREGDQTLEQSLFSETSHFHTFKPRHLSESTLMTQRTSDSPETVGTFWWNVGVRMPSFFRGLLFQFSKESFRYTCPIWIGILLLGAVYLLQPSLNPATRYWVVQLLSDTLSASESQIYLLNDPRYHQVVKEWDRLKLLNLACAKVKLQDKLGLPFEAITIQHIHSNCNIYIQFRSLEVDIHDVRTVSALAEGLPRSLYGKEPPVPWYYLSVFVVLAKCLPAIESLLAKCLPTYFTSQEQHGGWDRYELKITSHLEGDRSQVLLDWLANVSLLKNLVSLDLRGAHTNSPKEKSPS